jgi:hypothetical protein
MREELEKRLHTVFAIGDGKVAVMEIHTDAAGAFESIGLSRETA